MESANLLNLAEPGDTAFLFIDHQIGLLQTVTYVSLTELRTKITALAKVAQIVRAPIIITGIDITGASGPILPELKREFPQATYIERQFEINAWNNPSFVEAVKRTRKRTLVISGIWTSVCVTFPALSALDAGYKVFAVDDASGDISAQAHDTAVKRWQQAGIVPVTVNSIAAEMQQTWNRPEAEKFRNIYADIVPDYKALLGTVEAVQAGKPVKAY
ncbi:isochorismatase family protein [Mucilaginibacter gynuensis]|uniref:Isochorismatase family protein n=1 Tax=Mucilaginibacter gynuensis TaxID=1302236 RepID=A0ABP8GGJ3_9SPHI